ncbi:MAG: trehalose-6-phosphate synthase, partial [Candidatus Margulisbacteria bacterium]|nr:trehalose-6-phosphate synthase [Candidatus Margulisiibacteriota bacterium]
NLVAKEFVAAASDDKGMLVLSQFTGAARELTEAITFNPYQIEDCAEAIKQALTMPEEERKARMTKMKNLVSENNIYRWSAKIIQALLRLS